MEEANLATEEAKTALENSVAWYLADKLQQPDVTIATRKFLTPENVLVYLTRCNVAEASIPRLKVQVLRRVSGGIHETGYQLFGDHRLTKYENDMLFGTDPAQSADGSQQAAVSQAEAEDLLSLLASLKDAQQTAV